MAVIILDNCSTSVLIAIDLQFQLILENYSLKCSGGLMQRKWYGCEREKVGFPPNIRPRRRLKVEIKVVKKITSKDLYRNEHQKNTNKIQELETSYYNFSSTLRAILRSCQRMLSRLRPPSPPFLRAPLLEWYLSTYSDIYPATVVWQSIKFITELEVGAAQQMIYGKMIYIKR